MQTTQSAPVSAGAMVENHSRDVPVGLANFDKLPDSAHVGAEVVRGLYGVKGRSTLWKWAAAGRIPQPRRFSGSRINAWNVGELRRALAAEQVPA